MKTQFAIWATLLLALATDQPCLAGDKDNVHVVGTGLAIKGELGMVSAITYKVKLEAGKTYVIDMTSPDQKALDPFLRLLDAKGKQLAEDDDGGEGLNARIIYKVQPGAIFQVVATCFGKGRGPFTLTIREAKEGDKTLTKEDHDKLRQRNALFKEASQLIAKGNVAEAAVPVEKALSLEKAVRGNLHNEVVKWLNLLVRIHEHGENFIEARKARIEVMAIQTKVHGPSHWKATDARLGIADADLRAKMDPKQRALVAKANQLNAKVVGLYKGGKFQEAVEFAQEAMIIRKQVLGEKHPDYALSLFNLAAQYRGMRSYHKAEVLYLQALEIRKEVLGEKHPDYAVNLGALAGLYESLANYSKAEPLYRQALEIRKEVLGEKNSDYANNLNNLAYLYMSWGSYAKAEPLYRQALVAYKELVGEKHPDYAAVLSNLGNLYRLQGDYAQAEPLYRQVVDMRKEVGGEKHPAFATSLDNLAVLYKSQGNFAKMEPLLRQAREIRKEVLGERHPDYATSLNNLAGLHGARGNYAKAEPLLRQAAEIEKETLGEKHPRYATTLSNLAFAYNSQGNHAKAEPLFRQALEIHKEVFGEKHPDYATSLNHLALLYNSQGNYAKAEPLLRQALDIRKEVLGEKHPGYAASLNSLAGMYYSQGNDAKAEPLFRQALEVRKEALGEKHPDYAESLNNLANVYSSQYNYTKAEPLYRQALEIKKAALGEKHPDYAGSISNLAALYGSQGNYARAEALLRQAIDIHKEVHGEKHPDYARSLNNLAVLYKSQGNFAKAEPLYRQALEINKQTLGEKHPHYALSLNNLAVCLNSLASFYNSQGNFADAEALLRHAIFASLLTKAPAAIEDVQSDDLRIHPQTVLFLENHAVVLHNKITGNGPTSKQVRSCDHSFFLALTILDLVREDYGDTHESKTWLTAERFGLFPRRIRTLKQLFSLDQRVQDLEAAFWTAEQGSARTFLETLGKNRANFLAGVSPALQAEESQLLQDIRLLDLRIEKESARTLAQRNPDLVGELLVQRRDVETNLRKLIARIEEKHPQYAGLKYPRPCKVEEARAALTPDEVALLFVPGTEASFIVLVESRPKPGDKANGLAIIELPGAATLAEHVASLTDTETLGLPARARLLGRQAFDALLGPCKDRIKDKSLVIVPNGSLCFLPFELLVEEDGKYLVEKHRIRYAPSLTALHFINLWKQKRAEPEVPLFAVGDPVYGKEFQRLEQSGYEVAEIAKLLKAKGEFVLTRDKASKAEVKKSSDANAMAKARYVHFATHGILGLDRGKQPALVLNQTGKDIEESFLQMDEITSLKLNADLVVLSACKSGQGRLHQGEGVTGLARAFLYAGSKGVVCSLWSVDDRETANLMVDFYGHLQKGRSAPDALRESQLAMIRTGKAPLYWGPFIVIGE